MRVLISTTINVKTHERFTGDTRRLSDAGKTSFLTPAASRNSGVPREEGGRDTPLSLKIADPGGTAGRREEKEEGMEGGKETRKEGEGEKAAPCPPSPLPDLARAVSVADVWTRWLPGVGVAWPAVPQKGRRSGERRPRHTCSHCYFEG